jgi:DNA primase catalytic subunit
VCVSSSELPVLYRRVNGFNLSLRVCVCVPVGMSAATHAVSDAKSRAIPPAAAAGATTGVASAAGAPVRVYADQYKKYWAKHFPYDLLIRMLSKLGPIGHREIYLAYENKEKEVAWYQKKVSNAGDWSSAVESSSATGIHIGRAGWSGDSSQPMRRELVFDIDIKDYDDLRKWFCPCQGKTCCATCWKLVAASLQVVVNELTDAFGFTKLLPVFSGGGGAHLWCFDKSVTHDGNDAEYDDDSKASEKRKAIFQYFALPTKKKRLSPFAIYSDAEIGYPCHWPDALERTKRVFDDVFVDQLDFFGDDKRAEHVLRLWSSFPPDIKNNIGWRNDQKSSKERWQQLQVNILQLSLAYKHLAKKLRGPIFNLVLLAWPRLDEKVTTSDVHRIKCPFSPHASGRISVPLPLDFSRFDVASVPTLQWMEQEYTATRWNTFLKPLITLANDDPHATNSAATAASLQF